MPPLIGTGIPWYRREDYPRILEIMRDGDGLPGTYEEWEQLAEQAEREFGRPLAPAIRVYIDPDQFVTWCTMRGHNIDASGRMAFAGDPSNWPHDG